MGQEEGSKKGSGGKHFTYEQRVRMDALVRVKWPHGKKINFAEFGRLMGKARTTVRREYARGGVANKDPKERWFNAYSAEAGRQHANARGQDKGPRMKLTNRVAARFEALVTGGHLSPYAARAVMVRERFTGVPCVRSLYYAVASGLLVLTEHMSRRQIIVRLPDRTQKSVVRALDRLEFRHDNIFATMKSLTCDNGCEFLDSTSIERSALRPGTSRASLCFACPACTYADDPSSAAHARHANIAKHACAPFFRGRDKASDRATV